MVTVIIALSSLTVLISFTGTYIDANGSVEFSSNLKSCVDSSGTFSGSSDYFDQATLCLLDEFVKSYPRKPPHTDCYCYYANGDCRNINGQNDCGKIFTYYKQLLTVASWFDTLSLFALVTLSIVSCCIICCPGNCGGHGNRIVAIGGDITSTSAAATEPVYAQAEVSAPVPVAEVVRIHTTKASEYENIRMANVYKV